ncbi:2-dehydropantoate 2-reductase [Fusarium albosuccineum]|uniref:2-dehydropantoate 2-reductase n=1 Tax=Fusarium albosuccineum TaxID=1237068 RepID=A0A8H4L0U7_9HYPO|nr:2-dehydropantoate 2-reductase [Fusarium albosuccineum]
MADSGRVNVVFIGAGAVGCFYASRLHHPSHNIHVSLVARSNYAAIQKDGVKLLTRTFGDYTFTPDGAFPSVDVAAAAPAPGSSGAKRDWHYIFVTTKALPDISDDSSIITPLVGPKSCIVLIQNGVGVEEPFRKRFPDTPIVSAVTVVSAEQTSPGTIRQNRWTRISIGPYTDGLGKEDSNLGRRGTECTEALRRWWTDLGGIRDVEPHDEVGLQTVRWHKLCINAAMNPSAVLSGGRGNADMVADEELKRHLLGVMHEIRDAVPRILDYREYREEQRGQAEHAARLGGRQALGARGNPREPRENCEREGRRDAEVAKLVCASEVGAGNQEAGEGQAVSLGWHMCP